MDYVPPYRMYFPGSSNSPSTLVLKGPNVGNATELGLATLAGMHLTVTPGSARRLIGFVYFFIINHYSV